MGDGSIDLTIANQVVAKLTLLGKETQKLRDANNIVWTYNEAAELSNDMSYGYEMELDVNMKYWVFNRGKFGDTINEIGFVYSTTDGIRFVPNISEFLDSSLVYLGV